MKLLVQTGSTDKTVQVLIQDSYSTVGDGYVADTGNLSCYYSRTQTDNDVDTAAIPLVALASLTAAHNDGGIYPVDTGNMPGVYRLDLPDALFAATIESSVVMLRDSLGTGVVVPLEIQMVADDPLVSKANVVWDALLADHSVTDSFSNYIYDIDAGIDSLSTDIANVPTVAEFNARTIPSGLYALETTLGTPNNSNIATDIYDVSELIGTPDAGDVSSDIANVQTAVDAIPVATSGDIAEAVWALDVNAFGFTPPQAGGLQLVIDDINTAVEGVPTNAEFNARTIPSGDYLTASDVWGYSYGGSVVGDLLTSTAEDSYSAYTDTQALIVDVADVPSGVWSLPEASYNVPTTMGALLHDASGGAGGTTPADVWNYSSRSLSATGLNDILIDTYPLPTGLAFMAAILSGKISDAGTGTETFRSMDDSINRVVVTVDASGNRSNVVYN